MTAACFQTLKNRGDFLAAAKGRRVNAGPFQLQCRANSHDFARIGLTVTKKLGDSPARNRIRRRLRAAAKRETSCFTGGFDYVLVARPAAMTLGFEALCAALRGAAGKAASVVISKSA